MNSLQKKIALSQLLYFVSVVGILGIPYVIASLEMSPEQTKQLLITYAWEGILFGIICIWLPVRWVRHIPVEDKAFDNRISENQTQIQRMLTKAFRLPKNVAIVSMGIIFFAFAIGIFQLVNLVEFDLIQSLQALIAGIIIGITYAICTFFNIERVLAPFLGKMLYQSGNESPPRVFSIFSKVMSVCLGIMFVSVLFVVSISYRHSIELLESELSESAVKELNQLKEKLNKHQAKNEADDALISSLPSMDLQQMEHIFLLSRQGKVLFGKLPNQGSSPNSQNWRQLYQNLSENSFHKDIINNTVFCAVFLKNGETMLVRWINMEKLEKQEAFLLRRALLISGLILIVAIFLSYGLALSVSEPLRLLNEAAQRIRSGDFGQNPVIGSGDEVGALAYSFFLMEQALKKIILQVQSAATQINSASNEIVAATEQQASGASQQASSVGETSATLEELSTTARQISENSEAQAAMAESTLQNAEESLGAMEKAESVMTQIRERTQTSAAKIMDLGKRSQKITKVLGIINEIAAETKMLSLNAAIEASRAGEAGKGFSVVAAEIRKLAESVVKSTQSIEDILKEIQNAANISVMASEENVKIVGEGAQEISIVNASLSEIVHLAEKSTEASKEVSMTTGQQKIASEQAAVAMKEISEATKQMAAASSQTTASVHGLHQLAKDLRDLIGAFVKPMKSGRKEYE